jgi:hypothetical protein
VKRQLKMFLRRCCLDDAFRPIGQSCVPAEYQGIDWPAILQGLIDGSHALDKEFLRPLPFCPVAAERLDRLELAILGVNLDERGFHSGCGQSIRINTKPIQTPP